MVPSYHLSIETPTPLVLGVGVIFAPVTCFVTFVLFGRRLSGNGLYREYLQSVRRLLTLQALFCLRRRLPPRGNLFGSFASWDFFFFFFPPLRRAREAGGVSGCTWCFCLGGLPPLPLDLGRARGVAVPLGCSLGRPGALPLLLLLLLLLRERAKWELPARCRLPFPAPPTSLSLPNSHRTFHDVRIRGRLRSLATACYPPVVLNLRIVEQGRIRGPGHVGVALVDVAVVVALAPLPVRGQEVESVDSGHRPLGSLLVPACGMGALGLDVTDFDPRIDTGHTVTGGGLLTAPGRAISVRVSLPAGEIGVTASGRTLSRIARVTASGQAGDYLALLPACGWRRQDGWPDERPRRVLGRLPRSLLWFLKRRRLSLLLQEGRF